MHDVAGFTSLSQVAYQLSRSFARKSRTNFIPEIAHPFASVLMAVVFIESYFNESIEVAARLEQLTAQRVDELRHADLEQKLNGFLSDLGGPGWQRGEHPYQDFRALLTLRNELAHYKPEFRPIIEFPNPAIEQIARRFRHEYFGRIPWTAAVLTADVADWACQTARSIIEEFHRLRRTEDPWQRAIPGWEDNAWEQEG